MTNHENNFVLSSYTMTENKNNIPVKVTVIMEFVMFKTEDKIKTHFFIVFIKVIIKTNHVLKIKIISQMLSNLWL